MGPTSRTVTANAWKQLGNSTSLHRLQDNDGNYLGGHVPTIQPTAVPSHLETKHFWRKIKKDLISFTLFFQWEVYTITQDKPAGGHGEHFTSSLIHL